MTKRVASSIQALLLILCVLGSIPGLAQTTLQLATYGDSADIGRYELLRKSFEADHPEYKLDIVLVPFNNYNDQLAVLIAAGMAPDVFLTFAQRKASFVEQGLLLDVTGYIEDSLELNLDRFFPGVRESMTYQGRMWGTPWGYSSTVMYVNTDLLAEAGLSEPTVDWSIEEFHDNARKTTRLDQGVFGTIQLLHKNVPFMSIPWIYNLTGADWLSDDRREVLLDTPEAMDAFQFFYDLMYHDQVAPSILNPAPVSWPERHGRIAMWSSWLSEPFFLPDDVKWTMATYPAGPGGQTHLAHGHIWSIPSNHPNPDVAWVLAEWLASPRGEAVWAMSGRQPPLSADLDLWQQYYAANGFHDSSESLRFIIETLYGTDLVRAFEYWPSYERTEAVVATAMQSIFERREPVPNVLRSTAEALRALLNQD